MKNLVIIDTSVVLHQILNNCKTALSPDARFITEYTRAAIAWNNDLLFCPQWAERRSSYDVLWVTDSKPYWRSDYVPEYKAHRPPKPPEFSTVTAAFLSMATGGDIAAFSLPHQEADDLAAVVIRARKTLPYTQYFLVTVDSDWQGLVLDSSIFWCDYRGFEPRVRSKKEVYQWLASKWRQQSIRDQRSWHLPEYELFTCSDTWAWKAVVGDRADNLEPGTPLFLIDLLTPPEAYDAAQYTWAYQRAIERLQKPWQASPLAKTVDYFGIGAPAQALRFPTALLAVP